jgi:predicted nucleotidyltransferase
MMKVAVDTLLQNLTSWAAALPEIRAVALVGSRARGTARPDSDLDVVILSERPNQLIDDTAWTRNFGHVTREIRENWGQLTSIRVFYEGGLEVEFGVADTRWAMDQGGVAVLRQGFRTMVDRDGLLSWGPERP